MTITYEKVTLNSRDAADWLEKYKGPNRRTSESRVLQYQSDMENGRWQYDAAPIRISREDKLLDGKHRLTALANTIPDMEVDFLVVRGLDPETQLVMDNGGQRTAGQQLGLKGVRNAPQVSSIVKFYLDYSRNRLFKSTTRATTTKAEVVDWSLHHDDLIEQVYTTDFLRVDAPPSVVGAFALATMQFAPLRAHKFLHQLATGTGLQEGDPIYALDRRLRQIQRTNVKVSQREFLAYFVRAWNAWVSGNQLFKLQQGKLAEDSFPQILRVPDLGEVLD